MTAIPSALAIVRAKPACSINPSNGAMKASSLSLTGKMTSNDDVVSSTPSGDYVYMNHGGYIVRNYGANLGGGIHLTHNAILPASSTSAIVSNTINLGSSSYKFNEVHCASISCANDIVGGNLYSGAHTPVVSALSNVISVSAYEGHFTRVGDVVSVWGKCDIAANAGPKQFLLTVPLSSIALVAGGNAHKCSGSITNGGTQLGVVIGGSGASNKVKFYMASPAGAFGNSGHWYSYSYIIT